MKQYATGRIDYTRETVATVKAIEPANVFQSILINTAASGQTSNQIPQEKYNFLTVLNNSRFDFSFYNSEIINPHNILGNCPAYTLITFPIPTNINLITSTWFGISGEEEQCQIFVTSHNLGLVGQFRQPQHQPIVMIPDRIIYAGPAPLGVVFTASSKIITKAIYLTNIHTAASVVSIAHIRGGVATIPILQNMSIATGSTQSLGYIVFEAGDSLEVTGITGNISLSVYGEGF